MRFILQHRIRNVDVLCVQFAAESEMLAVDVDVELNIFCRYRATQSSVLFKVLSHRSPTPCRDGEH